MHSIVMKRKKVTPRISASVLERTVLGLWIFLFVWFCFLLLTETGTGLCSKKEEVFNIAVYFFLKIKQISTLLFQPHATNHSIHSFL